MNRRQFAAAAVGTATGGALIKLHTPPHVFAHDQRPRRSRVAILPAEGYSGKLDELLCDGLRLFAPDVKDKILDRPRAKEWAKWTPDDPTPDEMRRRLGAEGTSDEELLLRWIVGKEDIDAMRANPRPLEYLNSEQPLVNLLQELSKRTKNRRIHVQTPGFSVILERRA